MRFWATPPALYRLVALPNRTQIHSQKFCYNLHLSYILAAQNSDLCDERCIKKTIKMFKINSSTVKEMTMLYYGQNIMLRQNNYSYGVRVTVGLDSLVINVGGNITARSLDLVLDGIAKAIRNKCSLAEVKSLSLDLSSATRVTLEGATSSLSTLNLRVKLIAVQDNLI